MPSITCFLPRVPTLKLPTYRHAGDSALQCGAGRAEEGTFEWALKSEQELAGWRESVDLSPGPASAPSPGLQVCQMGRSEEASLGAPTS